MIWSSVRPFTVDLLVPGSASPVVAAPDGSSVVVGLIPSVMVEDIGVFVAGSCGSHVGTGVRVDPCGSCWGSVAGSSVNACRSSICPSSARSSSEQLLMAKATTPAITVMMMNMRFIAVQRDDKFN